MNVYFDLMYLYYLMATICAFRFMKAILVCQLERRKTIALSLLCPLVIFTVYFDTVQGYILSLVYLGVLFGLFYRRRALKLLPLYLLFLTLANTLNYFCYIDYTTFRSGVLVLKVPGAAYTYLSFPFFYLVIFLVTKMVDSLYHLRNYKTIVLIGSGKEKAIVSAYFDSGNSLRYRNCPVIFLKDGVYPFKEDERISGDALKTLSRLYGVKKLYRTLIKVKSRADSYFVYVAIKDDLRTYNGCDALLNVYLGG